MRILDLFSGLGGFSQAFKDRGHEVVTVDFGSKFNPTICADIADLTPSMVPGPWDAVLASPPCEAFSVMTIGKNWTHDGQPKNEKAAKALALAWHTLALINHLHPKRWVMENPRGKLRKLIGAPTDTTWWCQWKDRRAKPTDLWGDLPKSMLPLPKCKNGGADHDPAPRGTKTIGTQASGVPPEQRALIPYAFSLSLCLALEKELGGEG